MKKKDAQQLAKKMIGQSAEPLIIHKPPEGKRKEKNNGRN